MTIANRTTPPSTLAFPRRLTAVAQLMVLALAHSNHSLSLAELERTIPCSAGSASILTRRLLAAGLLKSYPPEYGLPTTFALDRNVLRTLLAEQHYGQLLSILPTELQAVSR